MWKYIKGATSQDSWLIHDGIEIVFWGRSNVGKSSIINALSMSKLAKISQNPGRTRIINYFQSDNEKIIVDLPGYGYAKLSKKEQNKISEMINFYFLNSKNKKIVLLLIDIKVGFTQLDWEMINYLNSQNLQLLIVGTKLDKAKQSDVYKVKNEFSSKIVNSTLFLTSTLKNRGIKELKDYLDI